MQLSFCINYYFELVLRIFLKQRNLFSKRRNLFNKEDCVFSEKARKLLFVWQ